jgi:NAD(P)-dependent dehydrogenase (short-subunit alcohol dehydrogenase family)
MPQRKPVRTKLALITGASRGLGLAIATELAARGFHLVLTARDQRVLSKAAARLPNAAAFACDIRDPQSVAALARELRRRRLDVLVNNAGIAGPSAPIAELDFAQWRDVLDTNLNGTFLVTQALLPSMASGGVIVNNLSIAARSSFPGMAAYSASKRGLLAFTETLREELRPRGIRVVALLPGAVDTEIWQQFWTSAPRLRMIQPSTIAHLVAEAVTLPANASLDEIVITPAVGAL